MLYGRLIHLLACQQAYESAAGDSQTLFHTCSQDTTDVVGGPHNLESRDCSCCAGGLYFFSLASWQVNRLHEAMAIYPDIAHKTQLMFLKGPAPIPAPNATPAIL